MVVSGIVLRLEGREVEAVGLKALSPGWSGASRRSRGRRRRFRAPARVANPGGAREGALRPLRA